MGRYAPAGDGGGWDRHPRLKILSALFVLRLCYKFSISEDFTFGPLFKVIFYEERQLGLELPFSQFQFSLF